ncbi:MAG: malto-oligosyltrehalose trehalohydrolase [Verrucomicrobia bacterium]|nr:malto-oligosyltrehalose trehalohydrolase [Verrucomicrobiota bacterium]
MSNPHDSTSATSTPGSAPTWRVWAPARTQVQLHLEGRTVALARGADGWWSATVAEAKASADYGFLVDGEGPLPDPRSPWQPAGVHGLSRRVDHTGFGWTDAGFQAPPLSGAVIYELHLGTFTAAGTCEAAIERLDHLVRLGVTHVELMPVNAFSGDHGWGYDGVALFAPHQAYGGPDGLKQLVNACHGRGLAVLLDVVYNHLGPAGNYLGKFAPYFNPRYATPWGEAVNFDGPHSDEVRRFFCDNALMWLRDYHLDGLRLDAVHAILDTSAQPFLEQLAIEVEQLEAATGRHLVLIPESDLNDPRLLWSRERGGFALDAQWSDDFHHALHTVLTGERRGYYEDFGSLADLAKALRQAYVYDGGFSAHRRRRHGRAPTGLSGHRFLGYAQNHDQIGNRAQGDRLSHLLSPGRLKVAAALVFGSPFVPMLFQGEEWGATTPFQYFTDHPEPELAQAVREGRRREFAAFGWKPDEVPDPQARETFLRSKLDWAELERSPHAELLEWHRRLIHLRRREPALSDGCLDRVAVRYDEAARWLVLERGPISLACNLAPAPQAIPLRAGSREVLLASAQPIEVSAGAVRLPAGSAVFLRDRGELRESG